MTQKEIPFHIRQAWWEYVEKYNAAGSERTYWDFKPWNNFRREVWEWLGKKTPTHTNHGKTLTVFLNEDRTEKLIFSFEDPL